jgi:anti-sigma factor RsiW
MIRKDTQITETELHAYADGRLSEDDRAAVEEHLAAHPELAAEVAHWQRQNEALSALFAPASEPLPARLDPHLIARTGATSVRLPQLAAAAMLALVLGGVLGWGLREAVSPTPAASDILIGSAVTAHAFYVAENRHAVEVAATEQEHLVSWLSNRLAQPISAPDLAAEGFTLVGGRLLPPVPGAGSGPAAQLMYENAAAERLTVFVTAALPDRADAYRFTTRDTLDAFYWANDRITCTVVGDLPEAEMQTVARKVYQQMTRRPDSGYSYMRG